MRLEKEPPTPATTRVLRVFSRLNIGGPGVHVILLTAGLRPRGYETRLVVGRETASEGTLIDDATLHGVVCERLPGLARQINPIGDLQALFGLRRIIREFKPHIVHTHTAKAGLLGRLAARSCRVPVVVHTFHGHVLRGYFGPWTNALYRWIEMRLARVSDRLVAVSQRVKSELVELGVAGEEKIQVVPLGLELETLARATRSGDLRRELGLGTQVPLVGVVGRLVPIKDIASFLEAAAIVRNSMINCQFLVVGDGEERSLLERRAGALGLLGAVRFVGWRRDLPTVLGDLDLVVNCSLNEGTPVALIEALAAGKPVVATRVGGTPDLLGDGAYGALVPASDPRALAEAVLHALGTGAATARARAQAGRRSVLERHSVDRLVADVDSLYRGLLERRDASA